MDDITALILDDHAAFRRGFARLDDARDEDELLAVWEALALHLDIHAEAEEAILYPHLVGHATTARRMTRRCPASAGTPAPNSGPSWRPLADLPRTRTAGTCPSGTNKDPEGYVDGHR